MEPIQAVKIERFGEPNKFDQYPYGTECIVKEESGYRTFKQMSQDEENPRWEQVDGSDVAPVVVVKEKEKS